MWKRRGDRQDNELILGNSLPLGDSDRWSTRTLGRLLRWMVEFPCLDFRSGLHGADPLCSDHEHVFGVPPRLCYRAMACVRDICHCDLGLHRNSLVRQPSVAKDRTGWFILSPRRRPYFHHCLRSYARRYRQRICNERIGLEGVGQLNWVYERWFRLSCWHAQWGVCGRHSGHHLSHGRRDSKVSKLAQFYIYPSS